MANIISQTLKQSVELSLLAMQLGQQRGYLQLIEFRDAFIAYKLLLGCLEQDRYVSWDKAGFNF
jgi:hypothetical protein